MADIRVIKWIWTIRHILIAVELTFAGCGSMRSAGKLDRRCPSGRKAMSSLPAASPHRSSPRRYCLFPLPSLLLSIAARSPFRRCPLIQLFVERNREGCAFFASVRHMYSHVCIHFTTCPTICTSNKKSINNSQ